MISSKIKAYRDALDIVPGAEVYRDEFGPGGYFFGLNRWRSEGMPDGKTYRELFGYDEKAYNYLPGKIGDNILEPPFEEKTLEETDSYIIVSDKMGQRKKLFRHSDLQYMPEFVGSAVACPDEWYNDVKPRLDPNSPERYEFVRDAATKAAKLAQSGVVNCYCCDGGYMYLRYLLGPEGALYAFYDMPHIIHDMMESWLRVQDRLAAEYQKYIDIDELFIKEDICYKTSSLISCDMIREFLLPYYRAYIDRIKKRNSSSSKRLYLGVDSDGHIESVIPLYRELGFTIFSPFEVAADCDVVRLGEVYPDITIIGGIDKRVLAGTKADIDDMLGRILPPMKKRGGFIPTCDHGVPENVSYENYLYYRKRCIELCE